ncbi:hypothetical protein E2C01_073785 [Portunus trituberculatus]|uniref:Uncharacterized protein n=1 Tax=Portunus trituberculatus TaxID=210409 RepID=A0A5B7IEF8_PORTR|nr:hypothetical protein [Portunus trituberculatus]
MCAVSWTCELGQLSPGFRLCVCRRFFQRLLPTQY